MNKVAADVPFARPLRLWPGVVIVVLQWLMRFAVPKVFPEALALGAIAGLAGGLLVLVWWVFFSRAPGLDRWGGAALMVVLLFVTRPLLHPSMATGAMGMLFVMYAVPCLSLALVVSAMVTRGFAAGPRRAVMAGALVLASAGWGLVRTGGFSADFDSDFAWRWAATAEDRLLAEAEHPPVFTAPVAAAPAGAPTEPLATAETTGDSAPEPSAATPSVVPEAVPELPVPASEPDGLVTPAGGAAEESPTATSQEVPASQWPGFRGPDRNGAVDGVTVTADWSTSPPQELWRRAIGPGWGSLAVSGDVFYTQEQRGDDEVVSCYRLDTGEPVWRHGDSARFWESNAGAGPRGTPTVVDGRVYTLGGTGIVNALDAATGSRLWTRDAAADTGAGLPIWGFSGSPLVVGDLVVVAASGALIAYDLTTGEPRWSGPSGGEGYSSPQLLTIEGVAQIVQLNGAGVVGVSVSDGSQLWEYPWKGYPIVQPHQADDGGLLISVNQDSGLRRLAVTRSAAGWSVEEGWTSRGLKPYFSDFVVHQGFAYGFDGAMLSAIDLKDGARVWKGGRYGSGQMLLLADQDLLLVLSEKGDLALVEARPGQFVERARMPAVKGKTWNHPVVVDGTVLVRNGEEMVAFRLAPSP